MKARRIKETSPDKVNSKLVKYRKGACLSIGCNDGKYLAVLVTGKFNKYYDFTLLDFYEDSKPGVESFTNGRVFGTRFGSWEELTFAVDKRMIECRYVDNNKDIEFQCNLLMKEPVNRASESYINDIDELNQYYLEEIPVRIEKTKNAEKFPDIAFASKHLIQMKDIIYEGS